MERSSAQVFHVVSRAVDRKFIFGVEEKGEFLQFMRKLEAFTGLEVLTYCLMDNHFHLLLHVPKRPNVIPDELVRSRMKEFYGDKKMAATDRDIQENKDKGDEKYADDVYDKARKRMYDLSNYVKELKMKFSKWYNARNDRKGTLWEERFKSVLVEASEQSMLPVSAYIELNPVRAGIVDEPQQHQWCSFSEAEAGSARAREGIIHIVAGLCGQMAWEEARKVYQGYFLFKAVSQNHMKRGMTREEYEKAKSKLNREDIRERIRTRIRCFTDGLVVGSKDFLKYFVDQNRSKLCESRKSEGSRMMKGDHDIYSYRKVE